MRFYFKNNLIHEMKINNDIKTYVVLSPFSSNFTPYSIERNGWYQLPALGRYLCYYNNNIIEGITFFHINRIIM